MIQVTETHKQKFWNRVVKKDQCWEWKGIINPKGYGIFKLSRKEYMLAHRFSWLIHNCYPTQCVLHRCDNPKCVNPEHLWEGSRKDNCLDRHNKGRTAKHNEKPNAKLSIAKVLCIRSQETKSVKELSTMFKVSPSTMRCVLNHTTWN